MLVHAQVLAEMNCSDMGLDLVAFLPLGVVGGWCSMLELDSVLPGSGLVIPAACACMGLAAVYKEGLGTLVSKFCKPPKDVIRGPFFVEEPEEKDDEDEADESLEVNLDEEITFEFLLGYGQWQTGLRLTYDAVISMEMNPPPALTSFAVMQQANSYKYRHFQKQGEVGQQFWGGGGWNSKQQGWNTQNYY